MKAADNPKNPGPASVKSLENPPDRVLFPLIEANLERCRILPGLLGVAGTDESRGNSGL